MRRVFLLTLFCAALNSELLQNGGFEGSDTSPWETWGFVARLITDDVQEGKQALECTNRTEYYQGPAQDVTFKITQNGRYSFTSHVKHLNDIPGKMFQHMKVTLSYTWADDGNTDYYDIAVHSFATSKERWYRLSGDFNSPQRPWSKAKLYWQGVDPGVDFIVDGANLTVVPEDVNWKTEANARIESIRKCNLTVRVTLAPLLNASEIDIEIIHKKHLFGFGSLADDTYITNPDYKQYQQLFYYMFNWATVGTFKWKYAQGTPDNPDYSFAIKSMNELHKNGMKVRGHNMFWGVPNNIPDWVKKLDGNQLNTTIYDRIKFITNITKGKLDHWDVNNELLHGQYFEETTGDANYSQKIYQAVHEADSHARLFLNDYDVLSMGSETNSYVEQVLGFDVNKTGLGGLGLQSHFRDYTQPDPTLLKRHLDQLSLLNLPLWITELDLVAKNEKARADWYEDALRMYFSHPAVHGVIFWGFWDHNMKSPYAALINGFNYYVNEAGKRYLHLIKEEWATHIKHNVGNGSNIYERAFMGDYELIARYQGKPVQYQRFRLAKDYYVYVTLSNHPVEINLYNSSNPFQHVEPHPHATHESERIIGTKTVKLGAGSKLTCETRVSAFSEIGDDKKVSTQCPDDMLLTSCTSYQKNGDWHKDGDMISLDNGKTECIAVNGFKSSAPVQAYARCCKVDGLQCSYKTSGPSGIGIDDESTVTCRADEYPMGCGAYTWVSHMDGAFPANKTCVAQNDGTEHGIFAYGSCCKAPNLTCEVQWSQPSDLLSGNESKVKCKSGWTLTGCSAFSEYGKVAGAYIRAVDNEDWCNAKNGEDKFPGEEGVKAVATCCQIT